MGMQERAKHESMAYQAYLKELMIKEAEDTTYVEAIRRKQVGLNVLIKRFRCARTDEVVGL
jgi:hypothetical protein